MFGLFGWTAGGSAVVPDNLLYPLALSHGETASEKSIGQSQTRPSSRVLRLAELNQTNGYSCTKMAQTADDYSRAGRIHRPLHSNAL